MTYPNLNVVILHEDMHDRTGKIVTTSLTLIDVHDIARSVRTFGAKRFFVSHPSVSIRKLGRVLKEHWEIGFGAEYNPNRKEALEEVRFVGSLDEAIGVIEEEDKEFPTIIATSAKEGGTRLKFSELKKSLEENPTKPHLIMLGTGWGMSEKLLNKADFFLEPIRSATEYNHLSVRSACAIMLDRLMGL